VAVLLGQAASMPQSGIVVGVLQAVFDLCQVSGFYLCAGAVDILELERLIPAGLIEIDDEGTYETTTCFFGLNGRCTECWRHR
jgi:hypothetical protein